MVQFSKNVFFLFIRSELPGTCIMFVIFQEACHVVSFASQSSVSFFKLPYDVEFPGANSRVSWIDTRSVSLEETPRVFSAFCSVSSMDAFSSKLE